MPRIHRTANVVWQGNVARGSGRIEAQSGALDGVPFTLASRVGDPMGRTSPEELISAAHAACFAMSLAGELAKVGHAPERLDVRSTTTLDEVEGGNHAVVSVGVRVRARLGDGGDEDALRRAVEAADAGCPVSNLLRASADVRVEAELAGGD